MGKKILVILITLTLVLGSVGCVNQKSEEINNNNNKIEVKHVANGIVLYIEEVALGEDKAMYDESNGLVLADIVKEEDQIIYYYDYK